MPLYQYACSNCYTEFEKRQRFDDLPLSECPTCHGPVHRVISPVGIIFKGSGFYVTDNKAHNSNGNSVNHKAKKTPADSAGKSKTPESAPAPPSD